MQFFFSGTLEELKNTICIKAQEANKDIVVYHNDPNTIEIGFQRLGHSGGRFFVANIKETASGITLHGDIADIYSGKRQTKLHNLFSLLSGLYLLYALMELILQIVWLPIFHFSHIWIPLLLPIPVLVYLRLNAIKEERKTDAEFIAFISSFTAKYCPYLKEYIDEGCCYDLQMILGRYIKESALPDTKIDKMQLSDRCSKCKVK